MSYLLLNMIFGRDVVCNDIRNCQMRIEFREGHWKVVKDVNHLTL